MKTVIGIQVEEPGPGMNIAFGSQQRHLIAGVREARCQARQIGKKLAPTQGKRLPRSMGGEDRNARDAELPAAVEVLPIADIAREVAASEKVRARGYSRIVKNRLRR